MKRIGIYAGTFDPVHSGHIHFALQAAKIAELDEVYFLPERRPRHKQGVEHFGHRTAMIARAIRPHAKLYLLELPDVNFNVSRTLPKLRHEFSGAQLVLLAGSDVAMGLTEWPDSDKLFQHCELVVGLRKGQRINDVMSTLPDLTRQLTIIESASPNISSYLIRIALRRNVRIPGLLASVSRYARSQWLYTSVNKL